MVRALTLLLVYQLAGEICSRELGLPVPGPVIGLALLAAGAMVHARITATETSEIEKTDLAEFRNRSRRISLDVSIY